MSPELISGNGHNYKTDIFSFGLMIYECVFGKYIFNDENSYWGLYLKYKNKNIFKEIEMNCNELIKDFIYKWYLLFIK